MTNECVLLNISEPRSGEPIVQKRYNVLLIIFGHYLRYFIDFCMDFFYFFLRFLPLQFLLDFLKLSITCLLTIFAILAFAIAVAFGSTVVALTIFFEAV